MQDTLIKGADLLIDFIAEKGVIIWNEPLYTSLTIPPTDDLLLWEALQKIQL